MSYSLICTYENFQAFEFKVDDIKNHIGSFLFTSKDVDNAYFNIWKEKMKETLSSINQGWKYIAVYENENGKTTECFSCYLKAFLLKTTYIEGCQTCSKLQNNMSLVRYDLVDFNHIKKITGEFQQNYFSDFIIGENARTILKYSKYHAELNLYLDEYQFEYIWLDGMFDINEEICFGPSIWNQSLEKKKVLQKMYPNSYEQYKCPIPSCIFTEDTMEDLYPIRYY
jgi:hypothetical protein